MYLLGQESIPLQSFSDKYSEQVCSFIKKGYREKIRLFSRVKFSNWKIHKVRKQ